MKPASLGLDSLNPTNLIASFYHLNVARSSDSILNTVVVCRWHIENRPHPNLHNLVVNSIGDPRPKESRPPLHRRIQQPQTRRLHKLPTHHFVLPLHHQLQRQRPKRETLVVTAGGWVRGRLGGGVFKEADKGCGCREFGRDGDESSEDARVAVGEVLDFEREISFLVRMKLCYM